MRVADTGKCGSEAGYYRHRRRPELYGQPCPECRDAWNKTNRAERERNRLARRHKAVATVTHRPGIPRPGSNVWNQPHIRVCHQCGTRGLVNPALRHITPIVCPDCRLLEKVNR